jgi:ribosomal protein S12 methylthiotransferase accessory factor
LRIKLKDFALSLRHLKKSPATPLSESLTRAKRLVSDQIGIISKVEILSLPPGEPPVFHARTYPADLSATTGTLTMNFGSAVSTDRDVAIIKAVGECVERYCSSHVDERNLVRATQEELKEESIVLSDLALYSSQQYSKPGFRFPKFLPTTPLYWVKGFSLSQDSPVWIPASLVYMPYLYREDEPVFHRQISTGLACGTDLASAIYRGILEVVERDAFIIVWQNQLDCPTLSLSDIDDPYILSLMAALEEAPVRYFVKVLTLDIKVTTLLVLIENKADSPPYTCLGMAVDIDPLKALARALEEGILVYLGMTRYQRENPAHERDPDYEKVFSPAQHGVIHAMEPELLETVQFLKSNTKTLTMSDLPNYEMNNSVDKCKLIVELLQKSNLQTHIVDLTTVDINDAGFKVIRAVIPGMQPLDLDHTHPHLGGKRLYEVPYKLGLISKPLAEDEMNPNPHPFP